MIMGFGGKLSGGKTVSAVRYAWQQGLKGKTVISNIKLIFPQDIKVVRLKNTDLVEFIKINFQNPDKIRERFYNSCLLLDEIGNIVSARRSSTTLNEMMTQFFMMLGKLSSNLVYTAQIQESQTDLRLRGVTNIYANCYRFTVRGEPLIMQDRIISEKIAIVLIYEIDLDILGIKIAREVFNPEPFFNMYDTREITLLDRSLYLKGGRRDLRKL